VPILPPPAGFGAIFDFRDFQKGAFWTTFSVERTPKTDDPECREPSQGATLFSLNHSNYRAVGLSASSDVDFG
jgi:hypothetical protein